MTGKIFRYSFLVGALALLLCAALFFGLQYRQNLNEAAAALRQETAYVARGIALEGDTYLRDLPSDKRVTWIDPNGDVLYDSRNPELPNQGTLTEVRQAMDTGSGQATRDSATEGVKAMYYAQRLPDGSIVRLSLPVSAVRAALIAVSPVLWVFVLVLSLSGILAFRAANQIVAPINDLDLDRPEQIHTYPELAPLVARMQEQRLTIDEQIEALHRQQKEFSALTDSMREGFVLLDRDCVLLSANAAALTLLPGAAPGERLPESAGERILTGAEAALAGERSEASYHYGGRSWQFIASPILSHRQVVGAVLLWLDVTERMQREQLRQEFSANVSHELKTPLTSISGFAELMATGTVPPETVVDFSKNIQGEAQRLIALVEDIIKLSRLDENAGLPASERVDLYELSEDVIDSLRAVAAQQEVRLSLTGEHAEIDGVWQLLNEMIYNLCDNAIKYNRPGGSVSVEVARRNDQVLVSVADTGIGIPEAARERVFERFYRVDKSHSRSIGGTGLGLSIVKHGAQYHGAKVSLQSTLGEGTTVTLAFPAPKDAE